MEAPELIRVEKQPHYPFSHDKQLQLEHRLFHGRAEELRFGQVQHVDDQF